MSQQHHAPTEEGNTANPVKMAIAVTVGAFGLIIGIILLAHYAVSSHTLGTTAEKANTPEAIAIRIAPVTDLVVNASKVPTGTPTPEATPAKVAAAPIVAMAIPAAVSAGTPVAAGGEGVRLHGVHVSGPADRIRSHQRHLRKAAAQGNRRLHHRPHGLRDANAKRTPVQAVRHRP